MGEGVSVSVTKKPEMQTQIATSSPRALLSGKALAPAHQICINAAISPPATTVTGDSKCWGTDRKAQQKWQNRERGSLEKRRGLKEWVYRETDMHLRWYKPYLLNLLSCSFFLCQTADTESQSFSWWVFCKQAWGSAWLLLMENFPQWILMLKWGIGGIGCKDSYCRW